MDRNDAFAVLFASAHPESARVALLLARAHDVDDDALVEIVERLFAHGDASEQAAILRALSSLPSAERFVPLARAASRTNVVPVFEALACENPFPARYLPDDAFRQLVLKAIFVSVRLSRVIGLDARIDDELRRMARDYRAERRAAGRAIPDDLAMLTEGT